MRSYVFAFLVNKLPLVLRHPGTALLAFARVEVGVEHSQVASVLVENLVGFHVRMIDGNVLVFLECDAIQAVGQSEDSLDDVLQLEVGP